MTDLLSYIGDFRHYFPAVEGAHPWEFISGIPERILDMLNHLDTGYRIRGNIAIHESAIVEDFVVLKGPLIISPSCFIGAHAYLRDGVFLGEGVSVGPGCEIKSSVILTGSRLAHFNFAGDSLIGSQVNMEAGSILANFHNDRSDKTIYVRVGETFHATGVDKFGALIGDHSKVGANAVCSPGTILPPHSIVRRLELVEHDRDRLLR